MTSTVAAMLIFTAPAAAGAVTYVPATVAAINLGMLVALSIAFITISPNGVYTWRVPVLLLASTAGVLMVCDAVNYKITGAPVNYYFWNVVSWSAIKTSFQVFPASMSLAIAIMLLPFLGGMLLLKNSFITRKASLAARILTPLGAVIVAAMFYVESSPAHLINSYARQAKIQKALVDMSTVPPAFTFRDDVRAVPGKNIVWVFLESFNDAFVSDRQFPGLTPNLSQLSTKGLRLGALRQIPGQQGSFTGMEAAQCGRYVLFAVPDQYDVCLGHVLNSAGYHQEFIAGYDPQFYEGLMQKLRRWHFDEIVGKTQFDRMPQYSGVKGGWGYFDSALFDYSYRRFVELQRNGRPFQLVLFTQDTHDGDYDTAWCNKNRFYTGPGKENKIVQAAGCTDALLGDFVRKISAHEGGNETVIVLVGDHIMHERLMHIRDNHDTVFGLILNGGANKVKQGMSTHMDIAPTVISAAGIRTNAMFLDGIDLLKGVPPARDIELSRVPKEVLNEFGMVRAPSFSERGIIYKHSTRDVYEYIRTQEVPYRERDGIRVHYIETTSYNWRNIMVFLDADDCGSLAGQPYALYTDQEGESIRFEFSTAEADAYFQGGRCGRLLSLYVSFKSIPQALLVGIQRPNGDWMETINP